MDEKNTYHFGEAENEDIDGIEIPQLDALIDELNAVLKKHGVGFAGVGDLTLINSDDDNDNLRSAIIDGLYMMPYPVGIEWLDVAHKAWHHGQAEIILYRKRLEEERAEEAALNERQKQLHEGVIIDGVRYKLVPAS